MAHRTPFVQWIEAQLSPAGGAPVSMNALALRLAIPAQYVARWRYDDQLPELWRVPDLAARAGIAAATLERIWLDSARILSNAKRPLDPSLAGSSAASLPPRPVSAAPLPAVASPMRRHKSTSDKKRRLSSGRHEGFRLLGDQAA